MKNNLILYGYYKKWKAIYEKEYLLPYMSHVVHDILTFDNIDSLKTYLHTADGKNSKNYIFPIRIKGIYELNSAGINNLFFIDSESLNFLEDKKKFFYYALNKNLNKYIPKHFTTATNNENITVIIKPNNSLFSRGVYKKNLWDVTNEEFKNNVVQKYIKHPLEYAGYFVSYEGNITKAFAYVTNYGNDYFIKNEGGVWDKKSKVRIELPKKIVQTIEKFLKPCSFTGTCCVDFKISDGKIYIFEINPRLGGSLVEPKHKSDFIETILELMRIYDERNVYN